MPTPNRSPRPTLAMILLGLTVDIISILIRPPSALVWRLERWRASAQTALANLQSARRP
jgi:hypothetical protein